VGYFSGHGKQQIQVDILELVKSKVKSIYDHGSGKFSVPTFLGQSFF